MPINLSILKFFSKLIESETGIIYGKNNSYQLESRLLDIVSEKKMDSIESLYEACKGSKSPELIRYILEKATNNETLFFRDRALFEFFKFKLEEDHLSQSSSKKIKIWSCACSSGQEPYSIAIICEQIKEKKPNFSYEILATDFSKSMIDLTRHGIFDEFQIKRGLNSTEISSFFDKVTTKESAKWSIKPNIKKNIRTNFFNLVSDTSNEKYDYIFCRNVLIYQNEIAKKNIIDKLTSNLDNDGVFILGAAEGMSKETKLKVFQKGLVVYYMKNKQIDSNLKVS